MLLGKTKFLMKVLQTNINNQLNVKIIIKSFYCKGGIFIKEDEFEIKKCLT